MVNGQLLMVNDEASEGITLKRFFVFSPILFFILDKLQRFI